MDAGRFPVEPTAQTHFAWLRTRMALERTLLAWVRTAVALIGFGFTIVQFFERFNKMEGVAPAHYPQAPRYLGLMLIGAGVAGTILSLWGIASCYATSGTPNLRPSPGLRMPPNPCWSRR